jgi:hypothetical protein
MATTTIQQNAPGAVASLVLGIVSIVISAVPFVCIGALICGIIGLLQSGKAKRAVAEFPDELGGRGLAVGGFVCSIIGICISSIYCLVTLAVIAAIAVSV